VVDTFMLRDHEDPRFAALLRGWKHDVADAGVLYELKLRRSYFTKRERLRLKRQEARRWSKKANRQQHRQAAAESVRAGWER
jgi:ribosomal protein S21